MNTYTGNIQSFISLLEDLRTQNDMISQDSTLITRYFQTPTARTDVVAQDVTNAQAAITQLLFAFDTGTPTQKSYLFKLLP